MTKVSICPREGEAEVPKPGGLGSGLCVHATGSPVLAPGALWEVGCPVWFSQRVEGEGGSHSWCKAARGQKDACCVP